MKTENRTERNNNRVLSFCMAVILCAGVLFVGCNGAETGTATNGASANNEKDTNGEKPLTKITFCLDWTPNTNHTGIYVAQNKGWFAEEGLDVKIVQPPEDGSTALVSAGKADFGIDFQDYLASAFGQKKPLPVTAVATILQHNTSGIISLKSKEIVSPAKMEGHKYATAEMPIEQAIVREIVKDDGGSAEKIEFVPTYVEDIRAGLKNQVDAVWIYYGWEGISTELDGLETNFFEMRDFNEVFDYYTPVIIANNDFLAEQPDVAKAFLRAAERGYTYAVENPADAAQILLSEVPTLDKEIVEKSQEYMADKYVADAQKWGYIAPERWNGFFNWLNEKQLVEEPIQENSGFTNDFLPEGK